MARLSTRILLGAAAILGAAQAIAGDPEFQLAIEAHRFAPAELSVPAGQKIRLVVENKDGTAEEFESYALNREKIVAPGQKTVIFVGPLKPGRYEFFGDFNPSTARGWLVVTP
jgi:plastocyanin